MLKKMMITAMALVVMLSINANAKEIQNQINNDSVVVNQVSDSNFIISEDEVAYLEFEVSVSCNDVNRIEVRDTDDRQMTKTGSIYYVNDIHDGYNNVKVEVGYYSNTKSADIEVWDNFGELIYFGQTEINVEQFIETSVSENSIEETDEEEVEEIEVSDNNWVEEESEVENTTIEDEEVEEIEEVEEKDTIEVSKPSVSCKINKNKLKVKIKAEKGTKLEIKYSAGKKWKTKTYSASAKNLNLKFKKRCKVRVKVRAYKVVDGEKIYSSYVSFTKRCK